MSKALHDPVVRISDLDQSRETTFLLEPDVQARAALAAEMDLLSLPKLRFAGTLVPQGGHDWRLEAVLGATVVQPCVVTLDPVKTRLDAPVMRTYVKDYVEVEAEEVEAPDDDTLEPLTREIDLARVMAEALALNLPDYPRTEGAEAMQTLVAEPGVAPLSDEDVKPFAGLAALRGKLEGGSKN